MSAPSGVRVDPERRGRPDVAARQGIGVACRRAAGILLHPTSLPGPYPIGDLGPEADRFLDWAASAGQSVWQILPLGPVDFSNSPYGASSTYAGNPLLISPEQMVRDGHLARSDIGDPPAGRFTRVDYRQAIRWKSALLRRAWDRARGHDGTRDALLEFREAPDQRCWLADWSLYAAIKDRHRGREWRAWDPPLVYREPAALAEARRALSGEVAYHEFVQMIFATQWRRVHAHAAARGIEVVGDLPIYVALDSADVWARPDLFDFDETLTPRSVAGVPPDYFSDGGQLWGNPLYRWDRLEEEGFAWWIERVRAELRRCDWLRIDHFRGLESYWAVPFGDGSARRGRWIEGPGIKFFEALHAALGALPLIAEDLGDVAEGVFELLEKTGLPGMRVLQFAFQEADCMHAPHRHPVHSVVYTGTHDNDTTRGWWASRKTSERDRARAYLGTSGRDIAWDLIRTAYASVAERAIVPMQDILGLGSAARMNTPSVARGNWRWRLGAGALTEARARRLRDLVALVGRGQNRPPDRSAGAGRGVRSVTDRV